MRKTIRVIINLFVPVFIFFGSLALIAISNLALIYKELYKDLGSTAKLPTMLKFAPYLKIIGFIGAGISLVAFLTWTILIIKSKGKRYLLETADATAIVLIIWIIGAFKLSILTYLLYQPMFNVINLIKD